jgi:hypothetical protein
MHVDVMARATEADVDAVVDEALALHAVAESDGVQKISRALFEDAGADAVDNVFLAAGFEDDGVDAVQMQKMSEQETGRAAAYNSNLGVHGCGSIMSNGHCVSAVTNYYKNPCVRRMTGVESFS